MSSTLWQSFLHDDVESFQRFLSRAARASSPWSRAQVNARDPDGRTLLHLIASSPRSSAIDFANAWLAIPSLDLYAQDVESGWTALHRALYAGNAAVARAVLARDVQAATDFSSPGGAHHRPGGLLQMKDREGNRPWDVYRATVPARDRMPTTASGGFPAAAVANPGEGDPSASEGEEGEAGGTRDGRRPMGRPRRNWHADEVGTFGSNKNLTLGLGDADDRQFPERIVLSRPEHLLRRFDREWEESRGARRMPLAPEADRRADRPFLIKSRPIVVQDLIMSKLHTAIVTDDPESNLWMCGVGPGGRLGTGDGSTRFGWVCIETGALAGKNVVAVALGQDHSIAVSGPGEVFTWGSNQYGQLGYRLPPADNRNDHPIQGTPRQIFNPFKGEIIIGAAASAIHSVVFTATGLYTFGKNDGQLGLVDSDARSLEMQVTPRRVGGSLFNSPIQMVSAIDRATAVLLESHDVWVFTQYGYSRVTFPLDARAGWTRNRRSATRYRRSTNHIIKVVSGGNTIGAMSSFGEVYTVEVTPRPVPSSMAASTTNPAKIRHSLSSPVRVWSVKQSPMAATDVDIGQGGSVIIGTQSGSAWREEKRAKIKEAGPKDSRFVRVPGLSRVVGVRSNAFGAYAVAQRDCEVTEKIQIDPSSLWNDYFHLLPFMKLAVPSQDSISLGRRALLREERSFTVHDHLRSLHAAVLSSPDIESQIQAVIQAQDQWSNPHPGMVWMASSGSHVQIPTHEFILSARSPVLRKALAEFQLNHSFTIPDVLVMERMENGQTQVWFHGLDFLSILNLVLLMYTDRVLDLWRSTRPSHSDAFRYRQVRTEVMRIATHLELRTPERAPTTSLNIDMESAFMDPSFFESGDVRIELNGGSAHAHSQVICQRCPFFGGLFRGRSGGRWLASRRDDGAPDKITVDLKDIDFSVFAYVLRHLYADTGAELFEDVKSDSLDEFMNLILDVMSAANELMIDRLSQICQKMLGRFGKWYAFER
jgi:inhibitor of Bruton tyrosine kinase